MGWPVCNTTLEDLTITETPVWNDYTFHRLGLWLSAVFGLVAIAVSFFVIFMHATHYLRPNEQRHIIRILFMVPIYAAVSFLSYYYYRHSVYFEVIRDCYEAFAIASFFSLLCSYLADGLHEQKQYFRTIKPKKWLWPMTWFQKCCGGENGILRTPRSGLTWFNVIWVAVFQYCFIRVAMTITAVITQHFDRYCLESLNPAFAHIWVMVVEAIAVTITMYCLIQFYVQIRDDIKEHSPFQKILAIKLVIFLSFWQTIILSFLTSAGAITASDKFQTPDIKVGIPAMLLCIEMALFAIFHIFAFSWRPYVLGSQTFKNSTAADAKPTPDHYLGGFLGIKAIIEAFNPWDMIKAVGRAARWLFVGMRQRGNDISYQEATNLETNIKPGSSKIGSNSLNTSTVYQPAGLSNPTVEEDRQTLLTAQQSVPTYPTPGVEYPTASAATMTAAALHYYNNGPSTSSYNSTPIGVAQSTEGKSRYYMQSSNQHQSFGTDHMTISQQQQQQQQQRTSYMPYVPGQETGVISTNTSYNNNTYDNTAGSVYHHQNQSPSTTSMPAEYQQQQQQQQQQQRPQRYDH